MGPTTGPYSGPPNDGPGVDILPPSRFLMSSPRAGALISVKVSVAAAFPSVSYTPYLNSAVPLSAPSWCFFNWLDIASYSGASDEGADVGRKTDENGGEEDEDGGEEGEDGGEKGEYFGEESAEIDEVDGGEGTGVAKGHDSGDADGSGGVGKSGGEDASERGDTNGGEEGG